MRLLRNVRDSRPRGDETPPDPRWVRALPGGAPRSALEAGILEVLAAHPTCPWNLLVAEVARHLRRSDDPRLLAAMDEGFWGGWVWSALARQELRRLEGVLLAIEASSGSAAEVPLPAPERQGASGRREDHERRKRNADAA